MKVLPKAKQVRFAQLVKVAGRPHSATLWTTPAHDPQFKKAMNENRVLTVRNVNVGTRKDRGVIGFLKAPNSTYLIFPKELPMREGTGVIGLKFDQLADEPVNDPVKVKSVPPRKESERVKAAKISSNTKKKEATKPSLFRVKVAFTATILKEVEVQAKSASAAISAAEQTAQQDPPQNPRWKIEGLEVRNVR